MSKLPHEAFKDERVTRVRIYEDGWVANSYRWKATGKMTEIVRSSDGSFFTGHGKYDRKRAFGRGPNWVAFSAAGGRLASG